MTIDWNLAASIAMPIVALFGGIWLNHILEHRPKLITFIGFISSHRLNPEPPDTKPTIVNTHSVVIKNAGRKAATNVRLGHNFLPDVDVYPDVEYSVHDLPGGGKEIVFPTLVPKKEITINYLYFPPETWHQINTYAESDNGPAKTVTAILQPQPKPWLLRLLWVLTIIGVISSVYLLAKLTQWAI